MKRMIPVVSALLLVTAAVAAETSPKQAEIRKVIDQFNGKWKLEITAAMPGETQKLKFPGTIDCNAVAMNSGVRCTISARNDKLGPIAEECLIASDPEGTGVHLMCVTNAGEVHDHKGRWSDDKTLTFEPFRATSDGKPSVEDVQFAWKDAKHMAVKAVTTVGDQKMEMEFSAARK